MKFLKGVLQGDERPVCRSHLHPIYLVSGFLWFLGLAGIGWIADYNLWIHFGVYIPQYQINTGFFRFGVFPGLMGWICTAGGAYIFAVEFIKFISTDMVITTKRLLYKTGFIKIKLDATDIVDILGVHIDQGWFGQFFGYGKIHLDCRFIDDVYIPYVKNPYGISKNLQKAKATLTAHESLHPADEKAMVAQPHSQPVPSQTLVQITGPVYIVDKIPNDETTPLHHLPKSLGENLLGVFRSKA